MAPKRLPFPHYVAPAQLSRPSSCPERLPHPPESASFTSGTFGSSTSSRSGDVGPGISASWLRHRFNRAGPSFGPHVRVFNRQMGAPRASPSEGPSYRSLGLRRPSAAPGVQICVCKSIQRVEDRTSHPQICKKKSHLRGFNPTAKAMGSPQTVFEGSLTAIPRAEMVFDPFHHSIILIPLTLWVRHGKYVHDVAAAGEHNFLIVDMVAAISA